MEDWKRLSSDELKRLSPKEKITYLKWVESEQRRELEKAKQEAEQEIQEAAKLIQETEEELAEEIEDELQEELSLAPRRTTDDLEEILLGEIPPEFEDTSYKTGTEYSLSERDLPNQEYRTQTRDSRLPPEIDRLYRSDERSTGAPYMREDEEKGMYQASERSATNVLKEMYKR